MVYIGNIKSKTRQAWSEYFWDLGLADNDFKSWLSLDNACKYLFILKATPDKAEIFPHGKWASIQTLESAIEDEVKEYIKACDSFA